jgi:hypothetical protein
MLRAISGAGEIATLDMISPCGGDVILLCTYRERTHTRGNK